MTDIKQAWLDALRGGSYNQASGVLRQYDDYESDNNEPIGYCCLGVLQEVAYQVAEIELRQDDEKLDEIDFASVLGPSEAYFQNEVEEYIAASEPARQPINWAQDIQDFLANRNDGAIPSNALQREESEKWNFLQIADWIEVNLENV
jgi:hypothetical protein